MKLGKFLGIDVAIHWSTLFIMFLVANSVSGYLTSSLPDTNRFAITIATILVSLGFSGSILAHEYGHALTGRKFGVRCRSITLHLFGGVAEMSSRIPSAKAEFWLALAGPVVSIVLGITMYVIAVVFDLATGQDVSLVSLSLGYLIFINIMLGMFNMIPAFPLDGGRVLRALIWWKNGSYFKATEKSVAVGKMFCIAAIFAGMLMSAGVYIPFFGVGIFSGVWLAALAGIIMYLGEQELNHAKLHSRLR